MSPRGQRVQLNKPVLLSGSLGLAPFNALSAAYLAAGHGEIILRFREAEARVPEGELTIELRTAANQTWQSLDLKGRIYNGYADAFYRGKLPEAILAFPGLQALSDFWDNLTIYLEQLLSLGFLGHEPVDELVPYFVLLGDGMCFSRMITALTQYLETMSHSYPALDTRLRAQILGRFLRATPYSDPPIDWPAEAWASLPVQKGLRIGETPPVVSCLQLAGGTLSAWERVRQCLGAFHLDVLLPAPLRTNAVERLELEQTWTRLSRVILPGLAKTQAWSDSQTKTMLGRARNGLLAIGQAKNAFTENDVETMPLPALGKSVKPTGKAAATTDSGIVKPDAQTRLLLEELAQIVRALPQSDGDTIFSDLIKSLPA
jgi:hypothetical protein